MKTLFKNIQSLLLVEEEPTRWVAGSDMRTLPHLNDAWLLVEGDKIDSFGGMDTAPNAADEVIDCTGKVVMPAWCDSHTHLVYAGSREGEFVDKINGLSYEEIAKRGGGILNSAQRLRDTPEDELYEQSARRMGEIITMGTGAVEIKSGYGLTTESELKMLRVARRLQKEFPLAVKTTFLGAHAFPAEYRENREAYVDLVMNEMVPAVAEEKLADYIDVFCDRGFFTPQQTERILAAGAEYGLAPKIHANELDFSGGIQAGVKYAARSVDHLECTGDAEIDALLSSETMSTLLPSTAFFLGMEYPPARKMIDAGLPVALASDYNPGSSPSGRMPFILSLACIKMKMLPEEAIQAATLNGAYAMGLEATHGSICPGKQANLIVTKNVNSYSFLPYAFGANWIESTYVNGARLYHDLD
ncbi:MAG: imidazolonepropionase [Flavobacteriales bacterium]|nr:imidazolonepropionase [Flavobacteriales bacterium]